MAKDYNQVLLDKGYTQDQINQMKSQVASGQKASDVVNNMNSQIANSKTTTTNTTPTTTSSYNSSIAKPEYQGTGTVNTPTPSYQHQGEGNYTYNPTSGYYEKQGGSTTQVSSDIANKWNSMSYAEQQAKLNANPNLKDALTKAGLTFKTSDTTPTTSTGETPTTGTTGTTQTGQWDYQDDSPERMAQIAQNLEGYKQTMPYLFNDKKAFDDFFINGVNRSQAQIDFLNDWFYKNQKYGKYDALTPDSIGYGIAYGDIPEDYLTMLKTTDPAKYQAALQAKQDAEDKIKDKTALDTTSFLSGDSEDTITSKAIEWLKSQGLFLDKDGNLIDDRTENYATDEEKQYAKDAADIIARNLDIDNTVKHTYEDLVKAYPGATKATLMAMAQDRNSDLLREKENNNVELTRLQGYMDYMQSERQERNRIGENAINQLQKQYGMYYQYSPEGISELAQAKYAATNVTLDQADYGTDAQKQMALQRVLDDYYAKYGDIIQRSEAQVINDVMALAKNKGISLSQALEENFLKYLRQKPGFEELSTIATKNPEIVKVGDNAYAYWDDNGNLVSVGGAITGTGVGTMRTERNNNPTAMTTDVAKSLGGVEGVDYIQGDSFQTGDGRTLYTAKLIGDPIETTIKLLDNAASSGKGAFYTKGGAQRWTHTAMSDKDWLALTPEQKQNVVLQMLQREGGDINKMSGYNQGVGGGTEGGQKRNPDLETFLDKWKGAEGDRLKEKDFWATYGKELEAKGVSKEDFLKQFKEYYSYQSRDAYLEILSNLDHLIELTGEEFDWGERASALSGLGDAGKVFKYIKNNLTVNGLQEARDRGLKLGVLSDSDVKMIAEAASVLDWDVSQGTWNRALQDFRQSLLNNNPYLKEQYKYQSAYSPNKGFKYNDNDRSFTFGTRRDESGTQGTTQGATTQAKSIKNLGK